jgi:hypothetical protein
MGLSRRSATQELNAALLLAALVCGCGGRESARAADDGNGGTAADGQGSGGTAGAGSGTGAAGSGGAVAGPTGSPPGGSSALPACATRGPESHGYASVADSDGGVPENELTERVTVKAATLFPTPESPTSASYTVETSRGDWQISVSHPELTEALIQVGDTLELRLASWPGYIPLTSWQNHAFGLFDDSDAPVLVGVDAREATFPVPDLSPLGLELEDVGATCSAGSSSCESESHDLRIRSGEATVELTPGQVETLGKLRLLLVSAELPTRGGGCDSSGTTQLVGIVAP